MLKLLRTNAGLSQRELSVRLDMTLGMVAKWENGRSIPQFDSAVKLADALGVSLDDLADAFNIERSRFASIKKNAASSN